MSVFDEIRGLSLSDFLEKQLNVKPLRSGKTLRFSSCPACGEGSVKSVRLKVHADDRHCKCYRCPFSGDILDCAEELWRVSKKECIDMLLGKTPSATPQIKPRQVKSDSEIAAENAAQNAALKEALVKIQALSEQYANEQECLDYLMIERNIPEYVIREMQRRKMLGFLPTDPKKARAALILAVGENLLKASGLWNPDKKASAIFFRPIVFFLPGLTSAEFRIIGPESDTYTKSLRYGESKLPYVYRNGPAKKAMIVEGFIDMMSAISLGYMGHVVCIPGCNNWNIKQFLYLAAYLGIEKWLIALDNDNEELDDPNVQNGTFKNPGQSWANILREAFTENNLRFSQYSPPPEMDINDILKSRKVA
jgi:hypothetical protein